MGWTAHVLSAQGWAVHVLSAHGWTAHVLSASGMGESHVLQFMGWTVHVLSARGWTVHALSPLDGHIMYFQSMANNLYTGNQWIYGEPMDDQLCTVSSWDHKCTVSLCETDRS